VTGLAGYCIELLTGLCGSFSLSFVTFVLYIFLLICDLTISMIYLTAKNYEVDRNHIKLLATIGKGQFGDVHRGVYSSPVSKTLLYIASLLNLLLFI
jgi:hypothetical protein